jgi:hypothetical protein
VIGREARAGGADRAFSPEINVATDPRFGRVEENFGEDPHLVGVLGVVGHCVLLTSAAFSARGRIGGALDRTCPMRRCWCVAGGYHRHSVAAIHFSHHDEDTHHHMQSHPPPPLCWLSLRTTMSSPDTTSMLAFTSHHYDVTRHHSHANIHLPSLCRHSTTQAMATGMMGSTGGANTYIDAKHVVVEAKHYASYAFGGKDGYRTDVSDRTLFDIYLQPWKRFAAAGGVCSFLNRKLHSRSAVGIHDGNGG